MNTFDEINELRKTFEPIAAPAALAQMADLPLSKVIKHFKYDPKKPWINQLSMISAMNDLNIPFTKHTGAINFHKGVSLVYFIGKWTMWRNRNGGMAGLQLLRSTWLGTVKSIDTDEIIHYDPMTNEWFTPEEWNKFVYPIYCDIYAKINGWRIHTSYEINN